MQTLISFDDYFPFPNGLANAEHLFKFHTNIPDINYSTNSWTGTGTAARRNLVIYLNEQNNTPLHGYLELGPYPGYRQNPQNKRFVQIIGFRYGGGSGNDPKTHLLSIHSKVGDTIITPPIFELTVFGYHSWNSLSFLTLKYNNIEQKINNAISSIGYIEIVREWIGQVGNQATGGIISLYVDGVLKFTTPEITLAGPKTNGVDTVTHLGLKKNNSLRQYISVCDVYCSWHSTPVQSTEVKRLGPIAVFKGKLNSVHSDYYSSRQRNHIKTRWGGGNDRKIYLFDENNDHIELFYNFMQFINNDPPGPVKAVQFLYDIKNFSDMRLYLEQRIDEDASSGPVEISKGGSAISTQKGFLYLTDSLEDQSENNYSSVFFLGD